MPWGSRTALSWALLLRLLALLRPLGLGEACSCAPAHPQQHVCRSTLGESREPSRSTAGDGCVGSLRARAGDQESGAIRAKISNEKVVPASADPADTQKMIRYEIKQIKMFKGFEKVSDIQYIYTPFDSSLCGVRLEANSQKQYLLTGQVLSDGKVFIHLCNYIEPWENLSFLQRESLNHHYHLNCGCQVRERPFPRSPPAIQCPAPSRPPMSASGQTGCWNGSSMGTRPSIMSA
nr:metalloproteinase inhibitor 4 isoform X2 [Vicugna pacos]